MHVGLVTACYEPVINGVTRIVSLYRSYLEKLGHRVSIFTLGTSSLKDESCSIYRSPGLPLGNTGYFLAPRYSRPIQKKIRRLDIIHCHHLVMGLEFAHRYGRCPILFTNHTRYDLYLEAYTKLPSQVTKLIMELTWSRLARKSDAIIIPADATRNILHKFGVLEPIQVIPNGIELSKFSSPRVSLTKKDLGLPDDAIVMIFVGRMSSEKNLRVLLNEFYVANQINRRLHLLLIGDGPNFRMLKTVVQKMNLANNIQLIGEVDNDQLPAYLAASDFFVTASTSEVHSLTLLEAIAAGLPVVAISSPGTDTVVGDGKTGLLADDKPNELADKMIVMAANRSIRTQYAKNASIASKKYDIRLTISRSLSLYEELLADKRLGIRN